MGRKKSFILLTPGPVNLTSQIRKALSGPALHHRSLEFERILESVGKKLRDFFQTLQPVLILNASGTGAMEAALSNTCSPGDSALFLSAGKFGERWRDMGKAYKLRVKTLKAPLGDVVSPERVLNFLRQNPETKAVFLQACETSTGAVQPINELAKRMKSYPQTLLIVDGVTGFGAMNLNMDKWGLDVLIGGSQKSFHLPAGLSFIALSEKAWKRQAESRCPKYYFDLKREKEALEKKQTAFSSNVTFIRALERNTQLFSKESRKNQILKCEALARSTWAFCEKMNLRLFAKKPGYALTAIEMPEQCCSEKIKAALEKNHGIIVAGGQGELKGQILRIGHLGPLTRSQHLKGLKALAWELRKINPKAYNSKTGNLAVKAAEKEMDLRKNKDLKWN